MKRAALAAMAVILAIPAWSGAGTAADPELADPAGDVTYPSADAGHVDITGIWFDTLRDDEGVAKALRVHVGIASPQEEGLDAGYDVGWSLDRGDGHRSCSGGATAWVTYPEADDLSYIPPGASGWHGCGEDGVTVLDMISVTFGTGHEASFVAGPVVTITIPFASLDPKAAQAYAEGSVIHDVFAQTLTPVEFLVIQSDHTGCGLTGGDCTPSRPYRIGD